MRERSTSHGRTGSITATLHALKRAAQSDRVSLGTLIDQLGQRTYGPLLFTIGLIAMSPIGAIPGASVVCATVIVLLAVQMSFGNRAPWVPGMLRRLEVDGELLGCGDAGHPAVLVQDPLRQSLIVNVSRKWNNGTVLRYHFLAEPAAFRATEEEKEVVHHQGRRH